ncbi:MAG: DUF4249 domain-containing protein [Bacteroidota bacterium]|nr:DUF4249 domain-containing protein [Bacteroidota bacterium]
MKIYNRIVVISLSFMLFFACSEPIDIDIEEQDRVIVLNGFINPDSTIRINLSKSLGVLEPDNNFSFITDAEVKLYEDGEFVENVESFDYGMYEAALRPTAGKTYRITASTAVLNNIVAETKIPIRVPITEVTSDFQLDSVVEQWWNPQTQEYFDTTIIQMSEQGTIQFKFNDPAQENNFYFVTISALMPEYSWQDGEPEPIQTGVYMQSIDYDNNTLPYENNLYMNNFTGYVFSDNLFDGQEHAFSAIINSWSFGYGENSSLPQSPLYIHLHSVTEDFYNFVSSYSKYDESQYNPFTEPVNVFSNIENGYGFFTGYSTYIDSVSLSANN